MQIIDTMLYISTKFLKMVILYFQFSNFKLYIINFILYLYSYLYSFFIFHFLFNSIVSIMIYIIDVMFISIHYYDIFYIILFIRFIVVVSLIMCNIIYYTYNILCILYSRNLPKTNMLISLYINLP